MVSVGGNLYSVPDATRKRVVEVHTLADEVRIFEDGALIAAHPVLEGRHQRRVAATIGRCHGAPIPVRDKPDPAHRRRRRCAPTRLLPSRWPAPGLPGRPAMNATIEIVPSVLDRIRKTLVGLKMPRALEVLDQTVRQLERGEASALEVIDTLFAEELTLRENRRVKMALRMAKLSTIKTLAGFDFSFQPSLDRNRILALAQLDFVDRNEVIHFLGPPGTGKSHLATALGVEAVKAGRSVYFAAWPISSVLSPRPNGRGNYASVFASSAAPPS